MHSSIHDIYGRGDFEKKRKKNRKCVTNTYIYHSQRMELAELVDTIENRIALVLWLYTKKKVNRAQS